MIDQLIERMFKSRNASQLEHWKTKSYAQHMALGSFYEDVIDILDKYVESHIGTFGKLKDVKGEEDDVAKMISDDIVWLHENRDKITQNVPALENIIDELTGTHMQTLYKLENLR